jgi:glycosyltransferase involved in cell wall biosynthesis
VPSTIRLLLLSSEFPPNVGGIGNHAYNLAKALAAEGFDVTVVADIIDVDGDELKGFAAKEAFKIYYTKRSRFVVATYFERVAKALKLASKADKIICSGKFSLWTSILIKSIFPRKDLTAIVHGTELDLKGAISKGLTTRALEGFNKIVSVSNYTQNFLPATLPTSVKKFVIHNAVNAAEFDINGSSALDGTPSLITVGNVTDRKGQENVVNALPKIVSTFPNVKYHIVGKPSNKAKVESAAKKLGVESLIKFYGAVTRTELLQKLKGATIKLMLSNHTSDGDFEGFGIAVLEANAFGVPAIGSENSGIADAIVHNETGILVDQHNPVEVANAVQTILGNYSYFSQNAKEWARQHDWKIIVKQYVDVLNA